MEIDIEHIASANFQKLHPILEKVYENNQFAVVIGDSGWGKTWNFEVIAKERSNVFRREIESGMDTTIFFNEIIQKFNRTDLLTNKLFYAIQNASNIVKEIKSKSMYIVDEAGNFKMSMHRHLRDFRKHTKGHSSLVLSGPISFYQELMKYSANNKYGIRELCTRVDRWIFLDPPTQEELVAVFLANNFDEKLIPELMIDCDNFRHVKKKIINYWIDHGIVPNLGKNVS